MTNQRDEKLCRHLFEEFSRRFSLSPLKIWCPDNDPNEANNSRIDLAVKTDKELFAIELTSVGPYSGFERDANLSGEVEKRLDRLELGISANEHVSICLPICWGDEITVSRLSRHLSDLMPGVLEELRGQQAIGGQQKTAKRRLEKLTVQFFLVERGFRNKSTFVKLLVDCDLELEKQRLSRFASKLPSKAQKLHNWKARKAKTLLILEDRDLQISNEALVASAVHCAFSNLNLDPDYILYLDASYSDKWTILPILLNGVWDSGLYDCENLQRFWHIKPLVD
ncbi:hypothetical protein PEL8287_03814 [Roseovarius litorisediminis]|uniref:Uncharacterized protein n=1 Tax=Roseovarius litorisediminis TaxID=1312363 RepID=A0A1Y5TP12_9RHOB|nr:hypothetical protein [Roseovarius litorisediminis]SLN68559.1 hypothetical protein PEL8287_03814 [Roseovarius litorisediminis]